MRETVLQAIREGKWDFEPPPCDARQFEPTRALPGTRQKLDVLCERIRRGLPLWHPADRLEFAEGESR